MAQIRLLNSNNYRLCLNQDIYRFSNNSHCHLCNKNNSFLHMLIECAYFKQKRVDLKLPLNAEYNLNLFLILEEPNLKLINKLLALTKHVLYIYKLST